MRGGVFAEFLALEVSAMALSVMLILVHCGEEAHTLPRRQWSVQDYVSYVFGHKVGP